MGRGRPNVETRALAKLEATQDMLVSGTLFLSGVLKFGDGSIMSSSMSGASGVSSHSALTDLDADDHDQYLHIDGRRGVLGDFGISGSLFLGPGGNGILVASASCLVLSCALDSTVITSGTHIITEGIVTREGNISNDSGHLIFSSSVGSQVTVSGNLQLGLNRRLIMDDDGDAYFNAFADDQVEYRDAGGQRVTFTPGALRLGTSVDLQMTGDSIVYNSVDHLILSSSVGSRVTVSGNLHIPNNHQVIFDDDDDTYIYAVSDDRLGFVVGSTLKLDITNNTTGFRGNETLDFQDAGGVRKARLQSDNGDESLRLMVSSANNELITLTGSDVIFSGNLVMSSSQRVVFDEDQDTYMTANADDSLSFIVGGGNRVNFNTGNADFRIAIRNASNVLNLGATATTSHDLVAVADVITGGKLEVDDVLYADGAISADGDLILSSSNGNRVAVTGSIMRQDGALWSDAGFFLNNEDSLSFGGTSSVSRRATMKGRTAATQFAIGVGDLMGRQVIFTSGSNITSDHGHPLEDDFAMYLHSGRSPTPYPDQYMKFQFVSASNHAEISTGEGHLVLSGGDGQVTVSSSLMVTTDLQVPSANTPSAPTFRFGDGDSGFYESSDDAIAVAIAATRHYAFTSTTMGTAGLTNGPVMRYENASALNPSVNPSAADPDTGIGWTSADVLSLIAGGLEGIRINEDGANARVALTGSVKDTTGDPSSPVEGEITINTSDNAMKVYAGGAWRTITTW